MSDLKLCCVRSQLLAGYKQCNIEIILLPDWVALYNGTPLTLSIDPCAVLDWLHVRKVFIVRDGIVIQNQTILGFSSENRRQVWNSKAQSDIGSLLQLRLLCWHDLWPYLGVRQQMNETKSSSIYGMVAEIWSGGGWPRTTNQQLYLYQSTTSPTSNINRGTVWASKVLDWNSCWLVQIINSRKNSRKHILRWDCISLQ